MSLRALKDTCATVKSPNTEGGSHVQSRGQGGGLRLRESRRAFTAEEARARRPGQLESHRLEAPARGHVGWRIWRTTLDDSCDPTEGQDDRPRALCPLLNTHSTSKRNRKGLPVWEATWGCRAQRLCSCGIWKQACPSFDRCKPSEAVREGVQ